MLKLSRKSILLNVLLLLAVHIHAQHNRSAGYVDGVDGLKKFFKANLELKQFNLDRNFHGTIVLRLQVNYTGKVDSMYVWFSPTRELGEETLRVLELTREFWVPEQRGGSSVNAWVQFPYHICRDYYCGYTAPVYNEHKKRSMKAFHEGDREKGMDHLRKAIYVEPSHGEDFYQMAKLMMEEGHDPDICGYLEIAQELTGNLYPEYFELCGEEREQYLRRKQEEKEDFNSYVGHPIDLPSEEVTWEPSFSGDSPTFDDRYPGGADSLRKFFAMNIRFPEEAALEDQGGLSVSSIGISPEGFIEEVSILNSLGPWIDQEVLKLLRKTRTRWKPVEQFQGRQTYVVQINFAYGPNCGKDDHISLFRDTILREVSVCAMNIRGDYMTIDKLKSKANHLISQAHYSDALTFLDEGARRDPFNTYFQEQKSLCYHELGWKMQETRIKDMLEAYHNGDSLVFLGMQKSSGSRRIIKPLNQGSYSLREIRLDSSIIYSGKLSSLDPEIRNGKFYFFREDGTVEVSGQYQDDFPVKLWNYYSPLGDIETFLDYGAVFKFLIKEESDPFIDSAYMGRIDLGANNNGSFAFVEHMPVFKGGNPARTFRNYLENEINYPVYAKYHGIEGTVLVQFTIDQEGWVREPSVIRGVHPDLNMEALRVIINSPQWKPGKKGRKPVAVVYTFPVEFYMYRRYF